MNFKILVLKENNSLTVILSGFAWTHDLHHFLLSPDVVLPPLWWKNSVGNSCKFLNHPEKVKLEWILFIRQTTNLSTDWVWLAASRGTTRGVWANSSTSLSAKFVILQLYKPKIVLNLSLRLVSKVHITKLTLLVGLIKKISSHVSFKCNIKLTSVESLTVRGLSWALDQSIRFL